jgi:ferredoxin
VENVFISRLKLLLDAIGENMGLYVPKMNGEHYTYSKYDPLNGSLAEFNNIRTCIPVKEFVFPLREVAAVFPEPLSPDEIEPFAVFGLKSCDLTALEIMDRVFQEEDFLDPLYISRREKMFIISSDCSDPAESCFCNLLDGKVYPESGFDLNVSKIKDGFIIEAGSEKGSDLIKRNERFFADVPSAAISERDKNRAKAQKDINKINSEYEFDISIKEIIENSGESELFDIEAQNCVECQACTRICPTCHCFFLYDTKQKDYFSKMKMWDSCMRQDYATVAGGETPRKIVGDRIKHRLMHKFVYFMERYGINMCVGCGRCIDTDIGGIDVRVVLKKLNEELKGKKTEKAI